MDYLRLPLLTSIVCAIIFGILGSMDLAYATDYILDQTTCTTLGGSWTEPPKVCTFSSSSTPSLTITASDTLSIPSDVTLSLVGDGNKNSGRLTNNGIITNSGTIEFTATDGNNRGQLRNLNDATFTNSGTIEFTGTSGNSGQLQNLHTATFTNSGTIEFTGTSGNSGQLRNLNDATFTNSGTIEFTGTSGNSGQLRNTGSAIFTNLSEGTITISGGTGNFSGQLRNQSTATFTNSGTITIIGNGTGNNNGQLRNQATATFTNSGTINLSGAGGNKGEFRNNSILTNSGTITTDNDFRNNNANSVITNTGSILVALTLNNNNGLISNCGTITFTTFLGNPIDESSCSISISSGTNRSYEDPTIGKTRNGFQVVENGFCILINGTSDCVTVDSDFIQHYDLRTVFSESIITVATTVYCSSGVEKCNYIAIGVSPIGTNMNSAIWKIILQKDHRDTWTTTVIDENGYLGEVTTTIQKVNDNKHLVGSFTLELVKSSIIQPDGTEPENVQINVEVRDSKGGYRDFKLNEGILVQDPYAYPQVETSYEKPIVVEELCLNENPNKRYTCAFDKVREWSIKNAEAKLQQIIN